MTPHWLDGPLVLTASAFRRLQAAVQRWPLVPAGAAEDARPKAAQAAAMRAARAGAGVAVIPVRGVLVPRETSFGWLFDEFGVDRLQRALRDAHADASVSAIVLDIDSPGGSVYGVDELADEIRQARASKPVVAIANPLSASGAYYLQSAATEAWVTPSGEVGSVGVYSLHLDWSRALEQDGITPTFVFAGEHKVEGNPYEPLTDDARQALQAGVDRYYDMFVRAVAKGRGVSVADVRASFGQGRVVGPKEALAAKMVDTVGTLDEAIARAARLAREGSKPAAVAAEAVVVAVADEVHEMPREVFEVLASDDADLIALEGLRAEVAAL